MDLLRCPIDPRHLLTLDGGVANNGYVDEGTLSCANCASRYVIESGIARLLITDDTEISEIKQREIASRDTSYRRRKTTKFSLRDGELSELDAFFQGVGDCRGLDALDVGCGVGEMTRVLHPAARLVAVDFSPEALLNFDAPPSQAPDLIQADACRLPLADASFDVAMSSQVLEHVPTAELRAAFIAQLARVLKPGGRLVLSVYNWDLGRQKMRIPKEGFHESGIFYHCYEEHELRADLSQHFDVKAIWGVRPFLPKTTRLVRLLGKRVVYWERLWRTSRMALPYCKLLFAVCHRPLSDGQRH
jgi:SAM-dependent methyltransferase